MRNTISLALACVSAMLLFEGRVFAQPFTYRSLDVPNSTDSWAMGIAPGGKIVGGYMSAVDGRQHGYVYDKGVFTTIDVPGSLAGLPDDDTLEGEVTGINPAGDMVGDYFAPPGAPGAPACVTAYSPPCHRGFLYRHGQFSNALVPGHLGTIPSSIAPDGTIYGCLHDQTLGPQMIGFVRIPSGDDKTFSYETLQSGGGELSDPTRSVPNSMNNAATPDGSIIVGLYTPAGAARAHGFVVQNGVFGDYVFPASLATQIWGINPTGDFVGLYRILNAGHVESHGFLQLADGSAPIALNYKDPITGQQASQTVTFAVNPAGAIVGFYVDASGHDHAYVALPADR
jgi:uncharacterized membrane protein